jgi:large conductance mechanosensitive channel
MDKKKIDKIKKEEIAKKGGKFVNEFKDFIAKGNVLDLAVGVVIGSAFGKIVSSIVDDIIMPIVGALIGGIDFTGLSIKIGHANITYGNFIQNVIDFLIIAFCIFIFIKLISRFQRKSEEEVVEEVKKDEQIVLLEEIRDLLKKDKE